MNKCQAIKKKQAEYQILALCYRHGISHFELSAIPTRMLLQQIKEEKKRIFYGGDYDN